MKVTNKSSKKNVMICESAKSDRTAPKKEHSYTTKIFGSRLVELRNERGLSQQQSADLIGISRNTLSMYERGERSASIDVAVSAANVYHVTLDYLFGTGYKFKKNNDKELLEMGFSENTLTQLSSETVCYYIDSVLSNPKFDKIRDLLYGFKYRPLINSYEANYVSKLVSDLIYSILVEAMKNKYELRPMHDEDLLELNNAIDSYLSNLEESEYLFYSNYDKYLDCEDTIESEIKKIQHLLEPDIAAYYIKKLQQRIDKTLSSVKHKASESSVIRNVDEEVLEQTTLLIKNLQEYLSKPSLEEYVDIDGLGQLFRAAKTLINIVESTERD